MQAEITLIAAFMTGLLGSVHCIGMCGGIVGSLSVSLPAQNQRSVLSSLPYLFLYNGGRLLSYAVAGMLVAWLGQSTGELFGQDTQKIGAWLSGLFMIALGFYIAGWWQILTVLEKLGSHLWRLIQPLGKKLLPVRNPVHAFLLGALWGWLPCGMVYTMLVFALATQEPVQGGLIMLSFGLGTLPTLVMLGGAAANMRAFMQRPFTRQLAGSLILLFGIYSLASPGAHDHHGSHGHSESSPQQGEMAHHH